jgi:hypothetical protein
MLLMLILASGLIIRLWGLDQMPFQHDEFSAISRLAYDSLYSLMREGVALRDSHPAGVQVFLYYWTKITGINHFWLRLPFVLLGTISIWLIFRAGSRLFGETAALYPAAAAAVMQYFVYYSQMARPYIPGVFFNLLAFNLILTIAQNNNTKFGFRHIGLAVSLALAAWVHHFSAFQAGLIYLAGVFLVNPEQRKQFIYVAILALLLYLPSLNITLIQLRAGGIGGWLGKPEASFLLHFLAYTANYSLIFAAALFAHLVLCKFNSALPLARIRLMLLSLFLIPLGLGWLYSIARVPVLQFSTLIFGFPFLLIALFSFARSASQSIATAGVLLILITGAGSLFYGRQHLHMMQQQAFKHAPALAESDAMQFGEKYTLFAVSSNPAMFEYYMPKNQQIRHRFFNKRQPISDFSQALDTVKGDYIGLLWADYVPYEWVATARSAFGEVIAHQTWFNAEYYLLKRSDTFSLIRNKERMLLHEVFLPWVEVSGTEYALLYSSDSLFRPSDDLVAVSIHCLATDTVSGARLVLEFRTHPDSLPEVWISGETPRTLMPGQTFSLNAAWRFDSGDARMRIAHARTYLWNPQREHFYVTERRMWTATYDKVLFGLFKPL